MYTCDLYSTDLRSYGMHTAYIAMTDIVSADPMMADIVMAGSDVRCTGEG